ncbi:hypothetical protein HYU12_01780 [Candidatus Woesearchaeota archaeon]|nr:hypothetical protein [Candidatus Woesearchaeota archaeon]
MMEPFFNRFSDIAENETRRLIIPEGKSLPAGSYDMVESFCNEKKCDCRRAFINVLCNDETIIATIGFGWESVDFYEKWAHYKSMVHDLKGPVLELGGVSTNYSKAALLFFKEIMMNDGVFLERLKRHYKMFKDSL